MKTNNLDLSQLADFDCEDLSMETAKTVEGGIIPLIALGVAVFMASFTVSEKMHW